MSVSEEDRPSLTADDSDDSGVHLKQTTRSCSDYEHPSDSDVKVKSCELSRLSSPHAPSTSISSSSSPPFLSVKDMMKEGCLLWAKIRGFSYWPGVTTLDPFEGITVKMIEPSKKHKIHVHFLAYDNLRAWVHESDLMPYEGYGKFKELSHQFPKRKKDFEPGKKFKNIFDRAVKDAEAVMAIPTALRLEKLGFVYIPTDVDGSTRNVLTKRKSVRRNKESKVASEPKRLNSTTRRRKDCHSQNKAQSKDIYEFIDEEADPDLLSDSDQQQYCDTTKESVPKLGSLIWGHMTGFPYWPCFVTRSSGGDYIRESKNKQSVHVQFFNWNDESGWVTKTIPWCSIAEFRRLAKEAIKNDSSCSVDWSPVGKMLHKWKNAALEAESTSHLSRKERHNRFLVKMRTNIVTKRKLQGHDNAVSKSMTPKFQTPPPPLITSSTRLPPGWVIRNYKKEDYGEEARTEYQSPDGAVFLTIENAISYLFQQNNSGTRKRSYSSPGGCIRGMNNSKLSSLPPGPASKKRRLDAGWFILESDLLRYPSKPLRPQIDYLDLDDCIEYIQDASLPRGWSVKRIRNGSLVKSFYLSPECKTYSKVPQLWPKRREFISKVSAASYFEGMGHPAVELEHVIATGLLQCLSRSNPFFKMDDYLDYRLSESSELNKIVAPTFVKLTPLPEDISQDSRVIIGEKDGKSFIQCLDS